MLTFFDLPREVRDEIYDWLWLQTPNISLQEHDDIKQSVWYSITEPFSPTIIYERTFAKLPVWRKTSRSIQLESSEAFVRRATLCISPFPSMGWGRSPDFLHSDIVHNIPAGALLSHVRAIELTLPLVNLSRRDGDSLHVACTQCCLGAVGRYLGAAKNLKSLKISLGSFNSAWYANSVCISLGGLRNFWVPTADLDRFEISVEGRFGWLGAAATFDQSLLQNFDQLARDIPTLKSDFKYKKDMLCHEIKCSFFYEK